MSRNHIGQSHICPGCQKVWECQDKKCRSAFDKLLCRICSHKIEDDWKRFGA